MKHTISTLVTVDGAPLVEFLKKHAQDNRVELSKELGVKTNILYKWFHENHILKGGDERQRIDALVKKQGFDIDSKQVPLLAAKAHVNPSMVYSSLARHGRRVMSESERLFFNDERRCSKCKEIKALDDMVKSKQFSCGYSHICHECNRKQSKFYFNMRHQKEAEAMEVAA